MFSDGNPREFYGMEGDRYRYWTVEQNKMFENALALFPESTPDRWHQIAMLIPGKSPWEVQVHYEELVRDLSEIESGRRELPEYGDRPGSSKSRGDGGGSGGMSERKKGIPWTEEEHKLFLIGLQKYGKGDWRSISRNSVVSRTPTQVASHAQKYYLRLNSVKKDKKRSSIHDITTADQPQVSASSPTGMMSSQNSPTSSSGYSQGMEFVGMADDPHSAFFGQQDIYGHFYPN